MAPLEPWEKVWVDSDGFLSTAHGFLDCQVCHLGEQSPDKDIAHTDLILYPSDDPERFCGTCHAEISATAPESLHGTLAGYWTVLETRGVSSENPHAEEMFGNHCAGCHASCGDCHVSRPTSVKGGLLDGHIFKAKPSMTNNCTACHGSRVGNEYLGKHEDLKADVHFRQGRMVCIDCHTGQEMHGLVDTCQDCDQDLAAHRYSGSEVPRCLDCHPAVSGGDDGVFMHSTHIDQLSCQVCHSVSYTSCDGCHVSIAEESGNPVFATEGSYLGFFIGKNPLQSEDRPYAYVPVRHVPISISSFDYYEVGMVSNFNAKETWVYATPHNIQRNTPQTEACENCHGNPEIFLTADNIAPEELEANQDVIVDQIPASW